jgi:hypothetical protein
VVPAGSNNFCIGGHLLVEDRKSQSDRPFDEHANRYTFGRPVGKRAVYLSSVPYHTLVFLCVTFCDYTMLDRERQRGA